jgi:hypothetical protein
MGLQAVVEGLEQDASFDFRLDFKLFTACAADKSRLCPNVDNRAGNVQVGRTFGCLYVLHVVAPA